MIRDAIIIPFHLISRRFWKWLMGQLKQAAFRAQEIEERRALNEAAVG